MHRFTGVAKCRFIPGRLPLYALVMVMILGAVQAAAEAPSDTVAASDLPGLLQEQGWRMETDAEGNRFYHQPIVSSSQEDEPSAPTPDIKALLKERGWRVETNAQGETLLIPVGGGHAPPAAGPADVAEPDEAAPTADVTALDIPLDGKMVDGLRNALEKKGWTVMPGADGEVTLYPPGQVTAAEPPETESSASQQRRGYYAGITLDDLPTDIAGQPIDNETRAGVLARLWVARLGPANTAVGKIRQINRIHVVSIVDSSPPFDLRNQLVIREDGSLIALY
ncbi:MAG: hypothetical protein KDH88_06220 [Chromatiales bacterium]|nr:hypothetical protein [Chromatiales bacterium]